jgi:hypothetical protein
MSLLLSDEQFAAARERGRAGDVTDELYGWLGRLVAVAQATRTLAPAPVPGGRWEDPDAVAETVQAWLEESLLRGDLMQAFDVCQTPRALSRYLERALRNWLVARSRRRVGPRLLERAAQMMGSDDEFALLRDSPAIAERWWGLSLWQDPPLFAGREDDIVAAVWALGDFSLLRYPSSERSDPVLSTPDLHRYLTGLLERVLQGLSGRHLDASFRRRFAYAYAPQSVGLDEAEELSGESSPADDVAVADAAWVALAELTGRQVRVLIERPQGTLEELAARLGVSRGTVDNEYRRALVKVRDAAPTDAAFDRVLESVLLLASEEKTS